MTNDLRARLADARLYLCTDSRRSQGDLPRFLDAVLDAGVDVVQLREKGLEAGEELALLEVFADACRRHGRLLAVNDRADVALAAGADVLHLGQDDLPVPVARRILGPGPLIGRSSHSPAQADAAAAEPGVDYFCAGPVWTTPTKPGRPGTGPGLLATWRGRRPAGPGSRSAASAWTGSTRCSPPAPPAWSSSGPSPRRMTRAAVTASLRAAPGCLEIGGTRRAGWRAGPVQSPGHVTMKPCGSQGWNRQTCS